MRNQGRAGGGGGAERKREMYTPTSRRAADGISVGESEGWKGHPDDEAFMLIRG